MNGNWELKKLTQLALGILSKWTFELLLRYRAESLGLTIPIQFTSESWQTYCKTQQANEVDSKSRDVFQWMNG